MKLLYFNEHLNCVNYDKREKPDIEVMNFSKGDTDHLLLETNEIIYVMEGRVKYILEHRFRSEGRKGIFLFFPIRRDRRMSFPEDTSLLVFRFDRLTMLCENFYIEKLSEDVRVDNSGLPLDRESLGRLETNIRLSHFVEGLYDTLSDGIKCCRFFEIKIKELFILLRAYYTKESLHTFFFLIMENETVFAEYVYAHWHRYPSIKDLADSLYMTNKQFYARFKEVFDTTPRQWMMKARAEIIFREITRTNKQFKLIAFENEFSSESQFTRFCKTMFHATPSEIRAGNYSEENI